MIATILNLLLPIVMATTGASMEVKSLEVGEIGLDCETRIVNGQRVEVCDFANPVFVTVAFEFTAPSVCEDSDVTVSVTVQRNDYLPGLGGQISGPVLDLYVMEMPHWYTGDEIRIEVQGARWSCKRRNCVSNGDGYENCSPPEEYSGKIETSFPPVYVPRYEDAVK